jgi:predicted transcriptional regulator of viral defense system
MWVVTPDLLSKQLDIPNEYSKNILADLARKGVLARFGRGKYVVVSPDVVYQRKGYTADPIMILDQLLYKEPYYVAYQSALYIHGIAHQLPFTTSVAVTKQKRPLKIGNSMIKFVTVKKPSMFGFRQQRYLDSYVNVSDLEKTILDCVDRHDLCGGIDDVTRSISEALAKINGKKLLFYLKKLRNQVLPQRLGFVLEKLISVGFKVDPDLIANMERLKGRHMHRLDFNLPKRGKKSNRWNIIENVDCLGWRHA